ncbi:MULTISPECIES: potassium ABC transporter ATPase [Paraburkholderia]|nr:MULTISPECIES: potassium ABC transporter ATPase [Paraburkholderia]
MDVLYIGGLAVFAALTYALIAGCAKLMQYRRVDQTATGARS